MTFVLESLRISAPAFCASVLWPMLWQSSLLIGVLFVLEFALRRALRPALRYALWLVVLVKLILPPSLALPTGLAWWVRPAAPTTAKRPTSTYTIAYGSALPAQPASEAAAPWVAPSPPPLPVSVWGLLGSSLVSVGLLTCMLFRWRQVTRTARCATVAPDWLHDLLEQTRARAGLWRSVRIKLTDQPMSPAVYGFFRPVLLLPRTLALQLPANRLRTVLLHELLHLRRGDIWVNCAQALLQVVYWWHPLLWLANTRIRRLREEAVDDAVMLALRDQAGDYAPTLLAVARLALQRPLASLGLVGILESRTALRRRIERLVDFHPPRTAGLTLVSLAGLAVFSAVALPMGEAPPSTQELASVTIPGNDQWPDPRFNGYAEIRLEPQFFSADTATVQAVLPNLLNGAPPLVLTSNEVVELDLRLRQANAQPYSASEPLSFAKFSGGSFSWQVGGLTNNSVDYSARGVGDRTVVIGAQVGLVATLPGWTPLTFRVVPWADGDDIRCELELSLAGDTKNLQAAQIVLPRSSAMVWARPAGGFSGLYELVVLRRDGAQRASQASGLESAPIATAPMTAVGATNGLPASTASLEKFLKVQSKVQDGKLLFEMGKLSQASAALNEALSLDPQSQAAQYYLNLVDEARRKEASAKAGNPESPPKQGHTNLVHSSTNRRLIWSKLIQLSFHEVSFDDLPLREVLQVLTRGSKQLDPEKRGVDFIVNNDTGPVGEPGADIGQLPIRLKPSLTNVRLVDVLDAIVKVAPGRIRYTIEDSPPAVVFSPKGPETTPLYTRIINVEPAAFAQLLQSISGPESRGWPSPLGIVATNDAMATVARIRLLFLRAGVDLNPPKSAFYNDGEGRLLVRGTLQDLDTIETLLKGVKTNPPPAILNGPITNGLDSPLFRVQPVPASTNAAASLPAQIQKVPVLGDIPVVGRLFRSNSLPSARGTNQPLYTRVIKVDPNTFIEGLASATGGPPVRKESPKLQQRVMDFFTSAGVNLKSPNSVFFNVQEGALFVRASRQDVDIIEKAVQVLNLAPPQINLKARFLAVPPGLLAELGTRLNQSTGGAQTDAVLAVLTAPQTRVLLRAAEANTNSEVLAETSVTTLSGRQTEISVQPDGTNWLNPNSLSCLGFDTLASSTALLTNPPPFWLALDTLTYARTDGVSIQITGTAMGTETVSNDPIRPPVTPNSRGNLSQGELRDSLPGFRLHQLPFSAILWDGQTLVLGGQARNDHAASEASDTSRKLLLVLITPTLIDPAGNRVHSHDNLLTEPPK